MQENKQHDSFTADTILALIVMIIVLNTLKCDKNKMDSGGNKFPFLWAFARLLRFLRLRVRLFPHFYLFDQLFVCHFASNKSFNIFFILCARHGCSL